MVKDRGIAVHGDHNITGNNLSNVGNVMNITIGASRQPLTLESKVAFSALLNSEERYPAPCCHPDTRVAARKAVGDWIAKRGHGSEKGIMWISGGPGVGKSALLQTVCVCDSASPGDDVSAFVDIEDDNSLIDACYFFGRGMGDREKASFFPATIAYQLVLSRASCGAAIQGILAKKLSILLESFPSQFRKLVLKPVKAYAASEAPVTIVIDALDECDSARDQVALLDAIFEAAITANIRFVIASRPEEVILAFFQRANVARHTYHVRLDNDFKASRDIEIFLCAKFTDIRERRPALCPRLPNGEEWPGSIIIYRLRDESDGQFIYATLVIAFIDTSYFSPDQQLKSLLAAPPARAFSKLDTLYRQILTRAPPELPAECDELVEYQGLVKGILRVVVHWENPLSATKIAGILEKEVGVVQAIILGPMASLFKLSSTNLNRATITLCHKSLRDYLLDHLRSQDFFLPTDSLDRLYIEVLSRQLPPNSSQSHSLEVLMGVLRVVAALEGQLQVRQIASFLDTTPSVVEAVIVGRAKAVFKITYGKVHFSTPCFTDFLLDAGRSGEFFISSNMPDPFFAQLLSRQPPSDPSQSYSRKDLSNVLLVVMALEGTVDVVEIADLLDVAPKIVEAVLFGPAKEIFRLRSIDRDVYFSTLGNERLREFLLDASRAGEYFISNHQLDTFFIQILSRQPPPDTSQSYAREVLMGVLRLVEGLEGKLKVPQIASFLYAAPIAVKAVIFGPAKAIFRVDSFGDVHFSTRYFKYLLLDADRAGQFFVLSITPDDLFAQTLSRQPPPDPSRSYSRKDLIDVLAVVVALERNVDVSQIADLLGFPPHLVEGIIFGPTKAFFDVEHDGIRFSTDYFESFLLDAARAGEFFISNCKIDTFFAQILSYPPPACPSQSYSREVLMGVLRVLVEHSSTRTQMWQIAAFLHVAPSLVASVLFGPAKAIFKVDSGYVSLCSWHFEAFLLDAGRAGDFLIHFTSASASASPAFSRDSVPDANGGLVGHGKGEKEEKKELKGTGGTDLVKFSKDARKRTEDAILGL